MPDQWKRQGTCERINETWGIWGYNKKGEKTMVDIITNPIFISVIVMTALCLLKMNVFFAIVISAILCGVMGGLGVVESIEMFYGGFASDSGNFIVRLLLGCVATCVVASGLGEVLAPRVSALLKKSGPWAIIVCLVIVAVVCETIITLGANFCFILIPPLLPVFNKYMIDRRNACIAIMAGLQIGYVCIPIGYGAAFQDIVADAMAANGIAGVTYMDVAAAAWPVGIAMIGSCVLGFLLYRKPRKYNPVPGITAPAEGEVALPENVMPKWELKHTLVIIAAFSAPVVQMITGSLHLGSIVAIILICLFRVVKYRELSDLADKGFMSVALVSFIMMGGAGYANISKTVGNVPGLVEATVSIMGGSKLAGGFVMLLLGLLVTMGIGSSWGTVPIVAVVMVPMGLEFGFSVPAILMLVCAAAALGDSGSPASNQTLIPTATFNIDGQHDHIWDTCVPSFICCNFPILVICTIFAMFM